MGGQKRESTPPVGAVRAAGVLVLFVAWAQLCAQGSGFHGSRNQPQIAYDSTAPRDIVSALDAQLAAGRAHLDFRGSAGYLLSVLQALQISPASQTLVFSETSAQAEHINPRNPRAVYFNDVAAVGWVRGTDALEIAAVDPRLGYVFYTLEQRQRDRPRFARQTFCLECHQTADTLGVPGPFVYSTFQMTDDPNAYASGEPVDDRTPFDHRWGGWYVTGRLGGAPHLGNVPVIVKPSELRKPGARSPELDSVATLFDTRDYPTACSDVAALMVLAHQTTMTNLMTWLGWEARLGSADIGTVARQFVDYLLFVDEAPLPTRIQGSCGFAEKFAALGPMDSRGRSLRQLDLERRLLRYRCSYMIYAPAFDALPPQAKKAVYERLWVVLSGTDPAPQYRQLTVADRRAVVEILRATKRDLPSMFTGVIQ
jgi:hypothetical protein